MKFKAISSFNDYLLLIESVDNPKNEIILFRGQNVDKPLLPTIARDKPDVDSTIIEMEMLDELKRRSKILINSTFQTDWEWLVIAQHYCLKTRLLDWTSNPLTALWFACKDLDITKDSYVYIIIADKSFEVDPKKNESPFNNSSTRIFKPTLNNERIVAQFGWFTAHKYSNKVGKFVALESNAEMKKLLTKIKIPASLKIEIISKLSRFGINNRTIYPDIEGLCKHLNWKYIK